MTTMPGPNAPDATVDDLVRRLLAIEENLETLTEARDAVKAQLRSLGEGRHATSLGMVVNVSTPKRFNATRARAALPADVLAQCQDFSATRAKGVLAPDLYAAFCEPAGEPRVSVRSAS